MGAASDAGRGNRRQLGTVTRSKFFGFGFGSRRTEGQYCWAVAANDY